MSKSNLYSLLNEGELKKSSTTVRRMLNSGTRATPLFHLAYGQTVPTDGSAGYVPGCLFQDTNATGGTVLYANQGSGTSCNFDAVTIG